VRFVFAILLATFPLWAHDAHGHATAPIEARHLNSPLADPSAALESGRAVYEKSCAGCHGADGKARTPLAATLAVRPTNLTDYLMDSMTDGEIYWVATHGIASSMPAFDKSLDDTQRWATVLWVRELRSRQRATELSRLGPYEWDLPPGFPYPNVPHDNPMTQEKVRLGRYLFYDTRLSLNQSQSCATCHQQSRAFTDGKAHGFGSTGQLHPRGPMSLVNVAYSPALTWANPNMRQLETQALVPMFGDDPVELGMSGKEEVLLERLMSEPVYQKLFAAAYRNQAFPFSIGNVTKAIASFERTILSGDSPYDRYRRGDDANAISESARRGETLFFSEKLECFHCHGGFNFTGTVDYFDKGFAEVEFHNTGLYNVKGRYSYPEPNLGLYNFTQLADDVGKFKAPTLRNIAVTAPYMHDGSIATLSEVLDHYAAGGRRIDSGRQAGDGSRNPNRSEFIKGFTLTAQEKQDVIAFLESLTDETLLTNPALSNPWTSTPVSGASYRLHGEVVQVFPQDGTVSLYHDAIPGLMGAMKAPNAMEYQVSDRNRLKTLKPGQSVEATVRKQGGKYVLEDLKPGPPKQKTTTGAVQ
jgi:cytochrome c peroxidase